METLHLITPGKEHEALVGEYIREHRAQGENDLHGGALVEKLGSYDDWLRQLADNAVTETVRPGWVRSSTWLVIRESDGKLIGMVDIRYELNAFLRLYGGNIGMGIRPSERGKGYGTLILEQALELCRKEGLKEVILACNKNNPASRQLILNYGGELEKEFALSELGELPFQVKDQGEQVVQRYRVDI